MTYIRILIAVSGLALLTACGGGKGTAPTTDAAKLQAELQKAKDAQAEAETSRDVALSVQATTENAMEKAGRLQKNAETERDTARDERDNALLAKGNADKEITRLKNELATAISERDSARGDKNAANLRITELEGELSTATSAKKSADADVLRLTQELADANRALSTANADVLRLTGGLKTVTGDKDTAESERDTARDERDKALLAKGNADEEITRLKKKLNTAINERDSATGDKNTANLRIEELVEAARLAGIAKTAADDEIARLKEAARLAGIAKTAADDEIARLKDEATQAGIAKTAADDEIARLKDEATQAGIAKTAADDEIARLMGVVTQAGIAKTAADDEIARLKDEATQAGIAKTAADDEIARLKDEATQAGIDKQAADDEIARLKDEATQAGIDKQAADDEIARLKDEATQAGIAKTAADDEIARLMGVVTQAGIDKKAVDDEIIRLNGVVTQAGIDKADADTRIEELVEAARVAGIAKTAADDEIARLKEAARLAGIDKQAADDKIARLKDEATQAGIDKQAADDEIARLKDEATQAGIDKQAADDEIARLKDEATQAGIAKTAADDEIARLMGVVTQAGIDKKAVDDEIIRLNGVVTQAGIDKADADTRIEELVEAARVAGIAKTAADDEIARLKEAARLAGIDKQAADDKIEALEGQLQTATNDKNAADAEVLRLTGDLEAANTEITRLDQFIRPTYATWKLAVNPEAAPNIIAPQNQFLQADADSISTEGTTAGPDDVQTLNLLTATFDGLPLDEEAADGVAFFQGQINGASYNYAGIFSGTDLGAPITNTAGTVAIWYGSFDHTLNPSKDFALTITFDRTGGTLDAFVRAGIANNSFIFDDVRFDTRGLITGEVLYTTFSPNDPTATPSTKTATLRGLIGEAGAVGVFVGEVGSNFAGGFVAHPTATLDSNKINFADWGGVDGDHRTDVPNADNTGRETLLYGVASVGNSNPVGNFIHGLATVDGKGFNFVGTSYASATVIGDVLYLGTDRTSGVAFSRVNEKYYAGLLPTTDLGVPITAKDLSVTWDAQFTLNSRGGAFVNPSFKMRVRFNGNGGTINSGTAAGRGFTNGGVALRKIETLHLSRGTITIAGKFGRDGVLYGTVSTATLTGLIGVNGAVGAFVGATLSGGFVAYPNVANTINAADWGGTAGNPKEMITAGIDKIIAGKAGTAILLNGFASVVNDGSSVNFIQGLPTLRGKGFKFAGTSFSDEDVYGDVLLLDEGSSSGVAFSHVSGTGVMDRKYYAGLLPGTNLGAPITDINTDVIWNAQFGAVLGGFCCDTQKYSHLGFTMQVIFDGSGGTINSGTVSNGEFTKGSVTVPYTNITSPSFDGSDDFNIEGKFGDDGLLYGTVVNLDENIKAALTGLIGVNGAVGAFVGIGRRGTNIAGGFVAYPIANVNFADWAGFAGNRRTTVINADNTGTLPLLNGAASVVNSGDRVNFIERLAKSDGQGFNFAGTPFANATVFGDVLYLDEDRTSGSGIAFSRVSGTGVTGERYYAGLLPGTALGSRITDPNTSAIWDARLMGVFKISNPKRYSSLNFKMQVIFDGNEGTINSGTVSGDSFTPEGISTSGFGKFNIEGKFGRDGLLYGKVGTNLEGTLTGLIGVDGAVGAFAFAGDFISYAGGFVAAPPQ